MERKALIHFMDSTFGGATPTWFKIGADIEDMSVNLNPEVDQKQNILGESRTEDKGYKPSMDADPYYAKVGDSIYSKIKDIAMNRKTGDDCQTKILEVIVEDESAESHDAWMEDVIVKPQSYGGDTKVNIPYNVSFNGNRKKGTVAFTNGVPTFTEDAPAANNG